MSRTTAILTGLLGLLLAIWGISSTNSAKIKETPTFLAVSDTSQIDYVKIKNEDGEIVMKRVGGNWKVTAPFDYQANLSYVQTMLEKLAELRRESFITSSKDKYADYELDDAKAVYVESGKEGGKIDKFWCGKANKNYTHTYMRSDGSDEVWLIAGLPRNSFTRRSKDWRDKMVLELDKAMIERIVIHHPKETVELTRSIAASATDPAVNDTTWQVTPAKGKQFPADDKPLNRVLNTASKVRALDFLEASTTDTIPDFASPDLKVEIFLEGGRKEELEFMPQAGSDNRWVVHRIGNDKTYFVVYESSAKNLNKKADDFKPGAKDEA